MAGESDLFFLNINSWVGFGEWCSTCTDEKATRRNNLKCKILVSVVLDLSTSDKTHVDEIHAHIKSLLVPELCFVLVMTDLRIT